ncbi:MAG: multifunctional oxoglutarate decarboxylase/oxoglutarate dehydrogenase thiamine pyrophosphate-binding subunit/dihydrolipoyllysine-residue succinyltransferase subunit [Acidobacteriota bacterium]|nr:multifunctional oxoglutarate decarboxylase/oxoglutarate dehydrogenase thiamine pyrophosphate-binding subunit/dihydrolipoyllysine-residue succinyltransferase subunit [Pyrinomonadaceae bacterium]MDW8303945.1 multifunctional oxoglutarate decarboxylase/oxoglutarate dehydrogenase thiamine pyrophosphate-binding subunit/dihydrolipoyllysine-residue succinyltransferase subunit [Acidobacteriota bacterium]
MSRINISEYIAENFGANASYVEALLNRYKSDPNLVDETWREFFSDLLSKSSPLDNGQEASSTEVPITAKTISSEKQNTSIALESDVEVKPITGAAKKIVENMEQSLTVPTATSFRAVPVKLLEENRRIINEYLQTKGKTKISFTHIIAYAIIKAIKHYPQMNATYAVINGIPSRLQHDSVNLGIAVDVERKDGTRNLLVPNIKAADKMSFAEFVEAYNQQVEKARKGKLELEDFQGTTITLTNPGTIGTVASNPRLMAGQSVIIATGAIEYPAEYQAMTPAALSQLGISKVMTITSTYDHRIIQGAESGLFLAKIHELLIGKENFYEEIFSALEINFPPFHWSEDYNPSLFGSDRIREQIEKQANVLQLINAYRTRGHLLADIDPLNMTSHHATELELENFGLTIWDLDREFITGGLHGEKTATLRRILEILRKAYCGKVGIEYRHIQSKEEKEWIRSQVRKHFVDTEPLPTETKKQILRKLIEAEQFEQFLHRKYIGQKRFSVEGCETIIPMLDQLVELAAEQGVQEIFMGMAHRGRLNVLCNVVDENMTERILTMFEGTSHPYFPADEGDVKYHQGAISKRQTKTGKEITIRLASNPSHLEFVNPVVEGMARARQDEIRNGQGKSREEAIDLVLPVLMHGDAAFAGQGIVMETLQLANLKGYRTGGTIHIVINNQIGFTTSPESGRSSIYSTDVAQMTQMPIFHINADDPEAAYRVVQIALAYRQEFNKDITLDLVGFRRLGHNEGDEPTYTQPLMYAKVKSHPGVRHLYAQRLILEGVVTQEELDEMMQQVINKYENTFKRVKSIIEEKPVKAEIKPIVEEEDGSNVIETFTTKEVVEIVGKKISIVPEGFHVNPKMVGQLTRRAKMALGEIPMDWGFAEAIAIGSLVLDGFGVRLSGQDSGRGTFSQRHASMYDIQTGARWSPLTELRSDKNPAARFYVFDSPLSEAGVLGFEYGYSVIAEKSLVMWEAQFGDFSNGAQVIIDQYISSSEDKWGQRSRLTLLLPHGYEGQGPEHSSARLERYLQLCAENNMQVCYPTTPAQYFHLLRRQMIQPQIRPLIVMTPKSLLRLPASTSKLEEILSGGFKPVIDDEKITEKSKVKRVIVCSGKVFYDLDAARNSSEQKIAIVRLEQFYPFPKFALKNTLNSYTKADEVFWVQEEPKNMGGWTFVKERIEEILPEKIKLNYIGRPASAAPATGSYAVHELEQKKLVEEALKMSTSAVAENP